MFCWPIWWCGISIVPTMNAGLTLEIRLSFFQSTLSLYLWLVEQALGCIHELFGRFILHPGDIYQRIMYWIELEETLMDNEGCAMGMFVWLSVEVLTHAISLIAIMGKLLALCKLVVDIIIAWLYASGILCCMFYSDQFHTCLLVYHGNIYKYKGWHIDSLNRILT